jgi:hypothetical protein
MMKDFKKNFLEGLTKTSQFIKETSEEAAQKLKESSDKLSGTGKIAKDKVIEVVNDVLAVLPLLEKAGYRTNEFKIGMSVTPVIEISFCKAIEVSPDQLQQLKIDYAEKTMFNMILSMLESAYSLSEKLETDAFDFYETIIEIAVPPRLSLRYVNKVLKSSDIHLLSNS